jgi:hypothetical protein
VHPIRLSKICTTEQPHSHTEACRRPRNLTAAPKTKRDFHSHPFAPDMGHGTAWDDHREIVNSLERTTRKAVTHFSGSPSKPCYRSKRSDLQLRYHSMNLLATGISRFFRSEQNRKRKTLRAAWSPFGDKTKLAGRERVTQAKILRIFGSPEAKRSSRPNRNVRQQRQGVDRSSRALPHGLLARWPDGSHRRRAAECAPAFL